MKISIDENTCKEFTEKLKEVYRNAKPVQSLRYTIVTPEEGFDNWVRRKLSERTFFGNPELGIPYDPELNEQNSIIGLA